MTEPVKNELHAEFMEQVIEKDDPTIVYYLVPGKSLDDALFDIMRSLAAIVTLRRRKGKRIKFKIEVTDEKKPADLPGDIYAVLDKPDGPITKAAREAVSEIIANDLKLARRVDEHGKGLTGSEKDFIASCLRRLEHGVALTQPMRKWVMDLDDRKVQ